MAISIYDTQAHLPPIDFGFLAGRLDKAEDRQLKNLELLGKAADTLPIKGGHATQNLAKEYNDTHITPILSRYSERIAKGEPVNTWYMDYMKDVKSITSDPVYNKIKEDEAAAPIVSKQVASPQHKYAAQYNDYYDPQNGYRQIGIKDIEAGWTPEEWYKAENPITYFDDFKDEFAAIKPRVSQLYGAPVENLVKDDQGNVIAYVNTQEGVKKEILNRDIVKKLLTPMFSGNNYETLLGSKPSLRYNTLRNNKYAKQQGLDMIADQGLAYTNDQALEDVTNSFLGTLDNETELAPRTYQTKVNAKPTEKAGFGEKADFVEGLPNEVAMTLRKLGTLNAEGDITGKTKARPEVLVPMIGGRKEGNNFVVPFDNANPPFLQVPKAVSGSDQEEDFNLAKALPYKASYESAKENLVEDMQNIAENQVRSVKGTDAKGNLVGFSYLPDGTIGYKDATAMQNPLSGWTSKINLDEFVNNYLPATELASNPNAQQLVNLSKLAKEQFQIDLSDPKIQAKIDKISSTEQGKIYQEVAQSLSTLQGNYEFYTDPSTDNVFLDNAGTPVAKGFIVLGKDELEQILPNYEEAVNKGIITPFGFTQITGDKGNKEKVSKYRVPIYRATNADSDNTTFSYVDAAYTNRKDIDGLKEKFILSTKNAFDELSLVKRGYQSFNKQFKAEEASKNPEPFKEALMDLSIQVGQIDRDVASQANGEIMDLYNRYQDKKISKSLLKKELYLMYLALHVKIAQQGDPTLKVPELELLLKTKESFK